MSDKLRDEYEKMIKSTKSWRDDCGLLDRNEDGYVSPTIEAAWNGFITATERAARICDSGCCEHTKELAKEIRGEV